jgi:hypothetical protein
VVEEADLKKILELPPSSRWQKNFWNIFEQRSLQES